MLVTPVSIMVTLSKDPWRRLSLDETEIVLSYNIHDLQGIFERYHLIEGVTKKRELLKNPTKIEEIQEK